MRGLERLADGFGTERAPAPRASASGASREASRARPTVTLPSLTVGVRVRWLHDTRLQTALGPWVLFAWLFAFAFGCTSPSGGAATTGAPAAASSAKKPLEPKKALRIGVTLHPYYSWTQERRRRRRRSRCVRSCRARSTPATTSRAREDIEKIADLDAIVVNGVGHDDFIFDMIKASGNTHGSSIIRAERRHAAAEGGARRDGELAHVHLVLERHPADVCDRHALWPRCGPSWRRRFRTMRPTTRGACAPSRARPRREARRRQDQARRHGARRLWVPHAGVRHRHRGRRRAGARAHPVGEGARRHGRPHQAREDPGRLQRGELPGAAPERAARRGARAASTSSATSPPARTRPTSSRVEMQKNVDSMVKALVTDDVTEPVHERSPALEIRDVTISATAGASVSSASRSRVAGHRPRAGRPERRAARARSSPRSSRPDRVHGHHPLPLPGRRAASATCRRRFAVDRTLPLTVAEFLALARQRRPVCLGVRPKAHARIAPLLERVGLAGFERRRSARCRAASCGACCSPTPSSRRPSCWCSTSRRAGLDEARRRVSRRVLRDLRDERGTTVLMVSHDVDQVRRADRRRRRRGSARTGAPASGRRPAEVLRRRDGRASTRWLADARRSAACCRSRSSTRSSRAACSRSCVLAPLLGGMSHLVVARRLAFFIAALGQAALTGSPSASCWRAARRAVRGDLRVLLAVGHGMVYVKRRARAAARHPDRRVPGAHARPRHLPAGRGDEAVQHPPDRGRDVRQPADGHGRRSGAAPRSSAVARRWRCSRWLQRAPARQPEPAARRGSRGVPTAFVEYLFVVLLTMAIVVSLKIIGALLVEAMVVVPAAAARNLARSTRGYLA